MEIGSQVRIKDRKQVGSITRIREDGWIEVQVTSQSSHRMARTRPQTYAVRAAGLRAV